MTLKQFAGHLYVFTYKQAYACLFGGLLLAFIVFSHYIELPYLYRYDYIFLYAVLLQTLLVVFRLETMKEVWVILVFHAVATGMELFKTSEAIGSWHYPEPAWFAIFGVPLFAGFMYSAVGSYIARAWRILALRFTNYPNLWWTYALAAAIYINFFTHHFFYDLRFILALVTVFLFSQTTVHFKLTKVEWRMPLLLGFILISGFIWIAENIATYTNVWLYPSQTVGWTPVSFDKLGAWFLLLIISFVLVTVIHRHELKPQ